MPDTNKHGLCRYIRAGVKHAVRKRCGFGCIFCGNAIIQYHHFDPPFADAELHDAKGITLLCGRCHDKVEKGLISSAAVVASDANPRARKVGYAKDDFLFDTRDPRVRLASTEFICQYPIVYGKEAIIGFEPPEDPGSPLRLQANLAGPTGEKILEIVDNEWRAGSDLFDLIVTANRLEIRQSDHAVILGMSFSSDRGLTIDTLNLSFRDCSVVLEGGALAAQRQGVKIVQTLGHVSAHVGVYFPNNGGVVVGTSDIPFLDAHVAEFSPSNDLERAMVQAKDSPAYFEAFVQLLMSSEVFVLAETGAQGLAYSAIEFDGGHTELIVITSPSRSEVIGRGIAPVGAPCPVRLRDIIEAIAPGTAICLNPYSSVSLELPASIVDSLRTTVSPADSRSLPPGN